MGNHYSVLYCTVLYCTVLYCTVLYCTILYSTVQYSTVQYRGSNTLSPCLLSYFPSDINWLHPPSQSETQQTAITIFKGIFRKLWKYKKNTKNTKNSNLLNNKKEFHLKSCIYQTYPLFFWHQELFFLFFFCSLKFNNTR